MQSFNVKLLNCITYLSAERARHNDTLEGSWQRKEYSWMIASRCMQLVRVRAAAAKQGIPEGS